MRLRMYFVFGQAAKGMPFKKSNLQLCMMYVVYQGYIMKAKNLLFRKFNLKLVSNTEAQSVRCFFFCSIKYMR